MNYMNYTTKYTLKCVLKSCFLFLKKKIAYLFLGFASMQIRCVIL